MLGNKVHVRLNQRSERLRQIGLKGIMTVLEAVSVLIEANSRDIDGVSMPSHSP